MTHVDDAKSSNDTPASQPLWPNIREAHHKEISRLENLTKFSYFILLLLAILLVVAVAWSQWLYKHQFISISNIGGFLQGTVGIVASTMSLLALMISITGAERQTLLSRRQNALMEKAEAAERETGRLERALDLRMVILRQLTRDKAEVSDAPTAHVDHLLRWAHSYLRNIRSIGDLGVSAAEFYRAICSDAYVDQLIQVFSMAENARIQFEDHQFVDHVWYSLTLEERALVVLLIVSGQVEIPKPSEQSRASWSVPLASKVPWPARYVPPEEILR